MSLRTETFAWILAHFTILSIIIYYREQAFWPQYVPYIGYGLIISGFIIWLAAKAAMGKMTVNIRPEKFVCHGIYKKIRHPLYLGVKLIFIGIALALKSSLGLVAVVVIILPYHFLREYREEKEMEFEFGKRYWEYKKKSWF